MSSDKIIDEQLSTHIVFSVSKSSCNERSKLIIYVYLILLLGNYNASISADSISIDRIVQTIQSLYIELLFSVIILIIESKAVML